MNLKAICTTILFVCCVMLVSAQSKDILAKSAMLNADEAYGNGQYSECLGFLKDAETNLGKTNSRIQYLKVKSLMAMGTNDQYNAIWSQAEAELKSFFEVTPENGYVPEKYDEMVMAVSKVKKYISDVDAALKMEEQLYSDAQKEKTIEACNNYMKSFPNGKYVTDVKERIKEITHQMEINSKINDYTKTIEIDPKNSVAYNNRGSTKLLLKDYQGAILDFTKSIELTPRQAVIYKNRGNAKFWIKDYQGAIQDFTKSIELAIKQAVVYEYRGHAKYNLGDYQGAVNDFTKAAELAPTDSGLYEKRGNAYSSLKDYQGAIQDYTKCINLNPNYYYPYYRRGKTLQLNLKDSKNANPDFEQTIKLSTDTIFIAASHYFLGNEEKAFSIFQEMIEKAGGNPEKQNRIYFEMAGFYSLDGNKAEAINTLKGALENGFDNFEFFDKTENFDSIKESPEFKELINKYKK